MPPFQCPLCQSAFFSIVEVKRPNGARYRTEFYECAGCTVMFRDPEKFTQCQPYKAPVQPIGKHAAKVAEYEAVKASSPRKRG
jgi:hypothetical protein